MKAETGLKSALAVKIFGSDLATLEEKARQTRENPGEKFRALPRSRWCGSWGSPA